METVKLSLVNNDHKVVMKTDLAQGAGNEVFLAFIRRVREELVTGDTATLEIACPMGECVTFEVAQPA